MRRNHKKKSSFASLHWESFEHLSMQMINDIYHEHPEKISRLTVSKKDGGYDGILCFPSDTLSEQTLYKVLMEAKLRSSNEHDLPLSDFSKTVIVAVNTVADKVYICTNTYFSAETVRRLRMYSRRIGLQIRTLDIEDIIKWITAHPNTSATFEDQALLQQLLEMGREIKPEQKELAFDADEENELVPTEDIIGRGRLNLLDELTQMMRGQNGILCIRDGMGCGKTVFIDNLAKALRPFYKNSAQIDLTRFSDTRGVFIKLLSIAWGESTNDIFAMSAQDLAEVTEYLGDEQFPKRSRDALIKMLHQSQQHFDQNCLLHSDLFLDYLRIIMPPIFRRVRSLILIRNVKYATRNALDFLISFMRILSDQPVSFLVELEYQDENCEYFLTGIQDTQTYIDTRSLPAWGPMDADRFISKKVPWLSAADKAKMTRFFGFLPLALSAGIDAFCQSEQSEVLALIRMMLPDSPPISSDYVLGYIDHIVREFARSGGDAAQSGLVLLGLFDGAAEISYLEDVASSLGQDSPIPTLSMCPFLIHASGQIRVSHGTYASSIRKFEFICPSLLYQTLEKIEERLETYHQDADYILKKRFEIFCINRNFDGTRDLWMGLAASYMQRGEQHAVYCILKKVYDWWMALLLSEPLTLFEQYWLLFHLTRTAYSLYGADSPELQAYCEQLDAHISQSGDELWPDPSSLHRIQADIFHTKSQISLGKADYQQMLRFAEQGIALVARDRAKPGLTCLGALCADKALALKHLYDLDSCVRFLKSQKDRLIEIESFMFCYNTHLASVYSVTDPKTALKYFETAKKYCMESRSERLHTEHNIATMHFLLGEYKQAAEICSQVWTEAYEYHVPIEKGRSDHLLGCIAWVDGKLDKAHQRFLAAYHLFQRHVHRTHIWPPLINLATLSMEMGCLDEALLYANEAVEHLLQYHLNNILHMENAPDKLSKVYVGLLLLLDCFHRCDDTGERENSLLSRIDLRDLHDTYQEYVIPQQLDVFLDGSVYLCGGKRILKV